MTLTIHLEGNGSNITSHSDFLSGGKIVKKVTVKCFAITSTLLILCMKPTLVCVNLCLCLYLSLCESSVISAGFILDFFACLLSNTSYIDPIKYSSNAVTIYAL